MTVTTPEAAPAPSTRATSSPTGRVLTGPDPVTGVGGMAAQRHGPAHHHAVTGQPAADPGHQLQVGSAFWPTPVPGVGISAAFDAFIGPGSGADGMTFTLADASATSPPPWASTAAARGSRGSPGSPCPSTPGRTTADPSSNFVGIATTNSPDAVVELRRHQHVDPVAAQHRAPLRGHDHLDRHHRDHGRHPGAHLCHQPAVVVLVGFTGGDRRVQRHPPGPERVHHRPAPPPPAPPSPASARPRGRARRHPVTITGTNLTGASAVNFGDHRGDDLHRQQRHVHHRHRPGRRTGTVDVTVTTGGGTSATTTDDQYTYTPPPPPTVTGVSPTSGPSTGGTPVTITGTEPHRRHRRRLRAGQRRPHLHRQQRHVTHRHRPGGHAGTVDVTGHDRRRHERHERRRPVHLHGTAPHRRSPASARPRAGYRRHLGHDHRHQLHRRHRRQLRVGQSGHHLHRDQRDRPSPPPPRRAPGTVDVTVTTGGGTSATSAADQYTYLGGTPAAAHRHARQPGDRPGRHLGHRQRHQLHRRDRGRLRRHRGHASPSTTRPPSPPPPRRARAPST